MSTQKIIYLLLAVFFLTSSLYLYHFQEVSVSKKAPENTNIDLDDSKKENIIKIENYVDETNLEAIDEQPWTDDQVFETNNWLQKHGFTNFFGEPPLKIGSQGTETPILSDYHSYDTQLLEGMSHGDAYAKMVLGSRMVEKGEFEEAIPLLEDSAVAGYARSMSDLYESRLAQARKIQRSEGTESARDAIIEALAWGHVIMLRFYPTVTTIANEGFKYSLEASEFNELEQLGRARGIEIYADLNRKRHNLGMGDFDTEVPLIMTAMVEAMNPGRL